MNKTEMKKFFKLSDGTLNSWDEQEELFKALEGKKQGRKLLYEVLASLPAYYVENILQNLNHIDAAQKKG